MYPKQDVNTQWLGAVDCVHVYDETEDEEGDEETEEGREDEDEG